MKLRQSITTFAPALLALAVATSPAYAQDEERPRDDATRVQTQESVARSNTEVNTDSARAAMLNDGQILQIVRTLNDGEIKQAEEALDEGESDAVKSLAEMIKNDHEMSNEKMDELLEGELNLEDSAMSETLGMQAEDTHELLQDLAGATYDCAYLEQQVIQHQAAIDLAETQLIPNAKDPGVKAYLTEKGPTLERHLQMAKEAQGSTSCASTQTQTQ